MIRQYEAKIMVEMDTETVPEGVSQVEEALKNSGLVVIGVKQIPKTRTPKQNDALHLYFDQLSEALNDAGFDMRKTIREAISLPWTADNIKEYLWRPVQMQQLGKESTTELDTKEIDKVYEIVNKIIGERTGIHIPFPSIESMVGGNK